MVTLEGKESTRMEYLTLGPEVLHTPPLLSFHWPEPITWPSLIAREAGIQEEANDYLVSTVSATGYLSSRGFMIKFYLTMTYKVSRGLTLSSSFTFYLPLSLSFLQLSH